MFGPLGGFDNDPFFDDTPLRMHSSFGLNMADPFGMFGGPRAALTGPGRDTGNSHALARRNDDMMLPFGGRSPFDSMFQQFEQMANIPNNAHTFSSSTVMSYSSGGAGTQPQMYRASNSTRTGPGGIKETRRQVQDSVSGVQKMSVGHQIGDKSHTIGKSYNSKTNEEMETHDFVNIDEDESDTFEREWDSRIHSFRAGDMITGGKYKLPSQQMAISSQPHHSHDYDDTATTKERKKEKRRHHHQDHPELDNELMEHDHSARTRPHHSHKEYDTNAHERTLPEVDHHHHHHSRPKAPGVSHRSSKRKVVDFSEADEKPMRKQHHYHSGHTQDDHHHRHSTKKSSTLV